MNNDNFSRFGIKLSECVQIPVELEGYPCRCLGSQSHDHHVHYKPCLKRLHSPFPAIPNDGSLGVYRSLEMQRRNNCAQRSHLGPAVVHLSDDIVHVSKVEADAQMQLHLSRASKRGSSFSFSNRSVRMLFVLRFALLFIWTTATCSIDIVQQHLRKALSVPQWCFEMMCCVRNTGCRRHHCDDGLLLPSFLRLARSSSATLLREGSTLGKRNLPSLVDHEFAVELAKACGGHKWRPWERRANELLEAAGNSSPPSWGLWQYQYVKKSLLTRMRRLPHAVGMHP